MKSGRIKRWVEDHPCIAVRRVELKAGIPERTLVHLIAGRRSISEGNATKVEAVLKDYGYKPTLK